MQPSNDQYFIPEQSKIPVFMALALGLFVIGASNAVLHQVYSILTVAILAIATVMFVWFRQVIKENLNGLPNEQVKRSYVMGMSWFIISEVFFFAAFFGALFYIRVFSVPWLGGEGVHGDTKRLLWESFEAHWPLMTTPEQTRLGDDALHQGPDAHMGFPGWTALLTWLPLWNTVILLTSSVTCHFAHTGLKQNNRSKFNLWLFITIVLAVIFLGLQYYEYMQAYVHYGLTLQSGVYGTTFFMLTGFHGFHVFMGTLMLLIQFLRSLRGHFSSEDHFGFEASSWYWHFVDVVWVGLFIFVYVLA